MIFFIKKLNISSRNKSFINENKIEKKALFFLTIIKIELIIAFIIEFKRLYFYFLIFVNSYKILFSYKNTFIHYHLFNKNKNINSIDKQFHTKKDFTFQR